jgi:two-component system, cell cycle response regulator DivK
MATKRVLVAEDSSVIQNLTKKILQFQNFDIVAVKNGKQVLDYLDKEDFDIILLDINMPLMDGMECAKHIRALPDSKKANVPIIAITGNAKNYTLDEFKNVGINEYLQKPLNFDALVTLVKKYTA